MKKFGLFTLSGLIAVACAFGVDINRASAIKQFQDEFKTKYVKEGGTDAEKSLASAVEAAKCNVCHDANSKSKKDHNVYGKALAELLDKKTDKDDKAKIQAALDTVSKMPSKADDAASPTFGDLIAEGKLPGGQ